LEDPLHLCDGSKVAVVGSGPAGSLFAYFLLEIAGRIGLTISVDIYEPKQFGKAGPQGCNMCGGIISESLVQNLASEGITLPATVVQRGLDSYVLHMDVGSVRIDTPLQEMRIGAIHRGGGPHDVSESRWCSFDDYLLNRALAKGARLVPSRVDAVSRTDGRPSLTQRGGAVATYDLLVAAVGVNSSVLSTFEGLAIGYERPRVTKTAIREYRLGEATINSTLGSSMHVFLLNIPRLEFAAFIPKGDYVTMCLLGHDVDGSLVDAFVAAPEVKASMPPGWNPAERSCQCMPHINIRGVRMPFANRFIFIGDCGVTRLYKDGIGAAYRTAKAAARTAVFEGVSAQAFARHYLPVCRKIEADNRVGRLAFVFTEVAQHSKLLRRALLRQAIAEQRRTGTQRRLSGVLWDMFSGSAPYNDIFKRMLHPALLGELVWSLAASAWPTPGRRMEAPRL
jgi:flavin-dependent dehydrogenase